MKKRSMKKWIPRGCYCDGCKYWHHINTIRLNKSNCDVAEGCKEECWSTLENSCRARVIKCDYINYTDKYEETLLCEGIKECGKHDFDKDYE